MAPVQAFAGSLSSKTKAELAEILKALDQDTQGLKADLEDRLEKYLTDHESALREDNRYKGLYISRRKRRSPRGGSQSATPAPGHGDKEVSDDLSAIKDATADLASKALDSAATTYDESVRPVLNSALDEGQDAASKVSRRVVKKVKEMTGFDEDTVRIPESPGRALRSQANRAVDAAGPAVEDGLEMAERARRRTVEYWRQTGNREFRNALRKTQAYLSEPERLVKVMLSIELAYLLMRLAPISKREFQFPPSQFSFRTFDRLLYGIFWWMPEIKFQYRLPEIFTMLRPSSHAAGGFILWSFFTVIPAFLLSHLISFMPQPPRPKPVRNTRSSQRAQKAVAPLPAWDPLVFCLIRFVIVLFPMTSAAPDFWRYQTEALGDLSGRALFAGLTGGMVLAERLGALVGV